METLLAVDLVLFCGWHCVLFSKYESRSLGPWDPGERGGLPVTRMTTQFGMVGMGLAGGTVQNN